MTVLDDLKALFEASLTPTPAVLTIGLLIVLLAPILLHFILSATTPYTTLPSVVLVGPSGAGKTALLTLFERGPLSSSSSAAATHTSQTPSSIELSVSANSTSSFRDDLDATGSAAKKFLLVDTPGHAKLRRHALSRLTASGTKHANGSIAGSGTAAPPSTLAKLKAVVFMVDAAALADGDALPSTAEYLYEVLLALQKRVAGGKKAAPVPVLVAANKLDLFTALPAALVKSNLEMELGRIRKTRSKGLLDSGVGADDLAAGEETDDWLGEYGSDKFTFKQMLEFDVEVDVIGGNVVGEGEGPGADKWWRWIAEKI
ncbi:signal recognition particle receptor beta subunit-domain-containing protein [Podospora appendiculata]|uniref:Signal recognition particle receptor subunit beta n=1 Tax=Podospora appendiculata TaxID=314037 RepID=A0AAE0WZR1_9PEZI|nr:signal recognition particle receptor beta subunit-domain-containing protein [Podospora appendiculata]